MGMFDNVDLGSHATMERMVKAEQEKAEEFQRQFAHWVGLLAPCFYHGHHAEILDWVNQVLAYYEVPEFWREPVRVMAAGAYYHGADGWMEKHAPWHVVHD
jgi:hypothetical protein